MTTNSKQARALLIFKPSFGMDTIGYTKGQNYSVLVPIASVTVFPNFINIVFKTYFSKKSFFFKFSSEIVAFFYKLTRTLLTEESVTTVNSKVSESVATVATTSLPGSYSILVSVIA